MIGKRERKKETEKKGGKKLRIWVRMRKNVSLRGEYFNGFPKFIAIFLEFPQPSKDFQSGWST
jgi:hypothetical protein